MLFRCGLTRISDEVPVWEWDDWVRLYSHITFTNLKEDEFMEWNKFNSLQQVFYLTWQLKNVIRAV